MFGVVLVYVALLVGWNGWVAQPAWSKKFADNVKAKFDFITGK